MSRVKTTSLNKAKTALIYMTPLVVYAFSLCGERILAADTQKGTDKKQATLIANGVSSNVQPVASGVKLLEGIFQKLRNQPQLAFGNSRAQNLLQAAGLSGSAGKNASTMTDQLLAIRPAERGAKGMRFDYAPNQYALDSPMSRSDRRLKTATAMPQPVVKPLAQSIQNFAGAAATLQAATEAQTPSVQSYGSYGNTRGQVIANTPMITEFRDAASKDSFSSIADARQSQSTLAKAKKKSDDADSDGMVFATASAGAEPMAPASPGLFKNIREFNKQDKYANANGSGIKEMFEKSESLDNRQIALLPPSIVSGVPLVHLGASALQIKESLGSKVRIDKQNIEDWNVWSVYGKNKSECALQLYFQHGVVEAIRVFDAGYQGVDLGVKLGSDLQTIKEKFGEPAFILPEPAGGRSIEAGKNYIYPISQVSFALARSHDPTKPAPQVVSMLIFNVK